MHTIILTGLNRITAPKPNNGGSTVLAIFDCEVNGIRLNGCSLVRTSKNGLVVWAPRARTERAVYIVDNSLRHQMLETVRVAYRALGGTDAEWVPRVVPDGEPVEDGEAHGDEATAGVARFLAAG